ncbi:ATP-binding protein [Psychrobacter sp. AOP22-C1-C5]|uniref:ATP-binding protein n=1 Tax=Psychrobacter sp. AOP22-C1-C5 TaxID=3457716 RepID=UPI0040364E95
MATKTLKSSVKVTTPSIKKKFKNSKPIESLYELIWNGFDAGATKVEVTIERNELEGIEEVLIFDDGNGIDFYSESCGFNKYDDSEKKNSIHTHGKDGVGRFSFHKISHKAEWDTKNSKRIYKTTIDSTVLEDFDTIELEENEMELLQNINSGTVVRLIGFDGQESLPSEDDIFRFLSIEFGWYLAIKKM